MDSAEDVWPDHGHQSAAGGRRDHLVDHRGAVDGPFNRPQGGHQTDRSGIGQPGDLHPVAQFSVPKRITYRKIENGRVLCAKHQRKWNLLCLESLFHLVQQHTGFDEVEQLFYSHKNYKRPELQSKPHHTFSEETAVLDAMVPNGAAYCLGAVNRDCWYLYTLSSKISIASVQPLPSLLAAEEVRDKNASNELGDNENYSHDNRASPFADHEVTLEIMMNDLDPEVMKIFTPKVSTTAEEATRLSGIDKIMPNVKIDDHLFYPCGYSMNGIFDNGEYMTIHITPESRFSYVSFESNTPQSSYMELIKRVLNLFRPANFIVTVLAKMMSTQSKDTYVDLQTALYIGEFSRREIQFLSCKSCDLTYALYEK